MNGDYLPDAFLHITPSGRFFFVGPSMSTDVVEMVFDGVRYGIPRNWIHLASIPLGHDKLMLTLHSTYPDMNGFTADNQGVLPDGYMKDRAAWARAGILAEPVRGMRRKQSLPQNLQGRVTEEDARTLWRCRGAPWFDGDGSPVVAEEEHGMVVGWSAHVEAGDKGVFFRVRYGTPLVEHWRDIRVRMSAILAGFVLDRS